MFGMLYNLYSDLYGVVTVEIRCVPSCLVFGHSLLPLHSGARLLLGGAVHAPVVMDRSTSIPTPYSQDLSRRVIWFVWNLGLSREEAAFYPGVPTWTVEGYLRGDTRIKRSLFSCEPEVHTKQITYQLRSWEYGAGIYSYFEKGCRKKRKSARDNPER